MEDSVNSMSKALSSKARTSDSPEESGWTMYFEEFLSNNKQQHTDCLSSGNYGSSSLVSDAASSAAATAKKFANNNKVEGFCWDKSCKNLSFKKRKTKGVLVDDALVDTASSPVNSPKVCHLNKMDINPKERDNLDNISQEIKGSTSGHTNERSELGFIGRDNDCTELKKRGLCLVPLSTLVNYLG